MLEMTAAKFWAFSIPKDLESVKFRKIRFSGQIPENGPWQNKFRLGVAQIHPKLVEKTCMKARFWLPGDQNGREVSHFLLPRTGFWSSGGIARLGMNGSRNESTVRKKARKKTNFHRKFICFRKFYQFRLRVTSTYTCSSKIHMVWWDLGLQQGRFP